MRPRALIIASAVAISLAILAVVYLLNRGVVTEPPQEAITPALLESLEQAANSNTAELSRLSDAISALNATLSAAQPAAETKPPPEAAEPTKKEESSEPRAELPPSPAPFLDYDNLPKDFLPLVGENEVFMLIADGSLARLAVPGSKVELRKDLETRELAQQLLLQHLEVQDIEHSFIKDAMAAGRYLRFDTLEDVQTFLKDQKDRSRTFVYQSMPNGEGFAVIDVGSLERLAPYAEGWARVRDLSQRLGVTQSMVFRAEAPKAARQSGDSTPFVDRTSK